MKLIKIGSIAAALIVVAASPTLLFAAPCSNPTPVWHAVGGKFINCSDNNPLNGFTWTIGASGTNSLGVDFICRDSGQLTGQGSSCQPEAGTAGDGVITVLYDYANAGSTTCPNTAQAPGVGRQVTQVIANNGASLILCSGYEAGSQTYSLEGSMPDDGAFGAVPISCNFDSAPELVSITPLTPTTDTVCLKLRPPKVFSDCDPTSNNKITNTQFGVDTCDTTIEPNAPSQCGCAAGSLYIRAGTCGTSPDPRISAGWTPQPTVPGPAGSVCYTSTRPLSGCGFVGATANCGGTESPAMVGSFQLAGPAAASPKARINRAAIVKGTLKVDFSTTTEVGAIGFNVLADGAILNDGLIAAGTDGGGHNYTFSARQNVLPGAKKGKKGTSVSIVVQTMTNTGPISSDPVKLQRSKSK